MSRRTRRGLASLWGASSAAALLAGLAILLASYTTATLCVDAAEPATGSGCQAAGGGFAVSTAGWIGLAVAAAVLIVSAAMLTASVRRGPAAR